MDITNCDKRKSSPLAAAHATAASSAASGVAVAVSLQKPAALLSDVVIVAAVALELEGAGGVRMPWMPMRGAQPTPQALDMLTCPLCWNDTAATL